MVIKVRNIITNTCKTNQLTNDFTYDGAKGTSSPLLFWPLIVLYVLLITPVVPSIFTNYKTSNRKLNMDKILDCQQDDFRVIFFHKMNREKVDFKVSKQYICINLFFYKYIPC